MAPRLVGVISDTHALVRPEALAALRGVDLILHAGDIGSPEVLSALGEIAATFAVRGNNDTEPWAAAIPVTRVVDVGAARFYLLHELRALDVDPAAAGVAAVVTGHSHRPVIETRGGVLYLNPGSAGPRRFSLPITVARVRVAGRTMEAEIVPLDVSGRDASATAATPARSATRSRASGAADPPRRARPPRRDDRGGGRSRPRG